MNDYIFTLFVRFFITVSGFVVFLITSKIFGAEGRGIIGYGTSMISLIGLILSFNLGRTFISITGKNTNLKTKLLPEFLSINIFLMIIAASVAIAFWGLSTTAKQVIDYKVLLCLAILMPNYVWSVNGNAIFASMNQINTQHKIIFWGRVSLILFVCSCLILKIRDIQIFILGYAVILSLFSIIEMLSLAKPVISLLVLKRFTNHVRKSLNVHVDYLSFNLFPLALILLAGLHLALKELGKLNFLIQLVNFIFTTSIVGSILMKKYVSDKGFQFHKPKIKWLFIATLCISFLLFFVVLSITNTQFFKNQLPDFEDTYKYYWILGFSLPGFITYQMVYPVLIEYKCMNLSMKTNVVIFVTAVTAMFPLIKQYGLIGACFSFSLFYLLVFMSEIFILLKIRSLIDLEQPTT